jgi:hypothetical protein
VKKKEKKMPRSKSVFTIDSSRLLDSILSEEKFTSKTNLEQIEYLNKYRSRRGLYRWGRNSIMDSVVDDQPGKTVTFNHIRWKGQPCNPITFRYVGAGDIEYSIRYPVQHADADPANVSGPIFDFMPDGDAYIERGVKAFLRHGVRSQWGSNDEHDKLFRYLFKQYENAWLDLKRRKVAEIKATLDTDSVNDFIAAKRAQHTQAIMDIAMSVGVLTGKLETYRSRIGSVTTQGEAEKMFQEVESAFRHFNYTQERNTRRLNKNVRLPGGKNVKKLIDNGEE